MDIEGSKQSLPRIIFFDLLRIFAIFLVVFVHILQRMKNPLGGFSGIRDFYYVSLGGIGVTLFLVLSGMALEYNHGHEKFSYGRFIIERIKRIYPLFWLSIVISVLLGAKSLPSNFFDFFLMMTGFSAFTGKPWASFTFPTNWFIGLIIPLYFSYPILSKLIKKHPNTVTLTSLVISVISRFYTGKYWNVPRSTDWFPLCRLFEFSFGIWLINNENILNFFRKISIKTGQNIITYFSKISFPIFLIHSTVLEVVSKTVSLEDNFLISIFLFLSGTFLFSNILFFIDNYIQKKLSKM